MHFSGKVGRPIRKHLLHFFFQLIARPFPSPSSLVLLCCSFFSFFLNFSLRSALPFSLFEHRIFNKKTSDSVLHQCHKMWCYLVGTLPDKVKSGYFIKVRIGYIYEFLIGFASDMCIFPIFCSKLCCFQTLHGEKGD